MAVVAINSTIYYLMLAGDAVGICVFMCLLTIMTYAKKIPSFGTLVAAEMKKKDYYFIHTVGGRRVLKLLEADKNTRNTVKLDEYWGTKYIPDSTDWEAWGLKRCFDAFEKVPEAHRPEYSAAITTFMRECRAVGISPTVNVIDALFYADMDPANMLIVYDFEYDKESNKPVKIPRQVQVDEVTYDKLLTLKEILQERVVENNLIVWDKVMEFLDKTSRQSSRNLAETKSVITAKVTQDMSQAGKESDFRQTLMYFIILGTGAVVILKVAGVL